MLIVDAHLDLSDNAVRGRAVHLPAREQPADSGGIPTVGLPDLRAGGVNLICGTIFCEPSINGKPGYRSAEEAHAMAIRQLDWYRSQESAGSIRLMRDRNQITDVREGPEQPTAVILLLEGADAIRDSSDVKLFFDAGLRIVGLAWKRTRYAGGAPGAPGPLTREGVELVKVLDQFGIIHDLSHLAEESFWELLDRSSGPVIASHSNCRSIVPTDRQISDGMIRAIINRGGVIGINFFDKFLIPPSDYGKRRATLTDVVTHIRHMCDLAGDAFHVGIGTDMDGGLGREEIPLEIETSADLFRVADALAAANYSDPDIRGILGENWRRFFARHLANKLD